MLFTKCVFSLFVLFQLICDVVTIYNDVSASDTADYLPKVQHSHTNPNVRDFKRPLYKNLAEKEQEIYNEKQKNIPDTFLSTSTAAIETQTQMKISKFSELQQV